MRFTDGEFVMIGLEIDNKPLMRAYSIASPSHQDYLEFYSIKVQDGPLTSVLQHIQPGDELLVNSKAVGTLVVDNLKSGRNLYLLSTGTGIAPFMSLVRGYDVYENYEKVILDHGVREVSELAIDDYLNNLNNDEIYGELTQGKFLYYPTVTREDFKNTGRVTDSFYNGKIQQVLGIESFDKDQDSVMICGSNEMNLELQEYFVKTLKCREGNSLIKGDFVLEKAFVEK